MRKTCTIAALLALSPLICAQDNLKQRSPALPVEVLGPPLVVWSAMQQPQPIPAIAPADNDTSDSHAKQSAQQPSAQTFTGMIAKDGGKSMLKVSENMAYQLDDQEIVKSYEGRQVRIAGNLDAKNNILYITNIKLIS
jgi:hypothetical protein